MDLFPELPPPYTERPYHIPFIKKLPGELLWRIFYHAANAQETTAGDSFPVVLALVCVCKQWRTLILSSPERWTSYLSITRGSHLALFLDTLPTSAVNSRSSGRHGFLLLQKCHHSFNVHTNLFVSSDNSYRLHLDPFCDDLERSSHPLCLDVSLAQNLHVLDLSGCYITLPRSLTRCVHLRVLRLKDVGKDVGMGASEWIHVLQNLPELEELEINNALGYHYDGVQKPRAGVPPIICERLHSFKFAVEINLSLTFLPRIMIPNLTSIDLELFWEPSMPKEIFDRAEQEVARIMRTRSVRKQLPYHQLWFGWTDTSIFLATDSPHSDPSDTLRSKDLESPSFSIRVSIPFSSRLQLDLPSVLSDLIDSVITSCHDVKSIGIKGSFPDAFFRYNPHHLVSIFSDFKYVEQLSVHMSTSNSLRLLVDTLSTYDENAGILLPNLRKFTLTAVFDGHQNTSASALTLVNGFTMKRKEQGHPVLELITKLSEKSHPLATKLHDQNLHHRTFFEKAVWYLYLRWWQ